MTPPQHKGSLLGPALKCTEAKNLTAAALCQIADRKEQYLWVSMNEWLVFLSRCSELYPAGHEVCALSNCAPAYRAASAMSTQSGLPQRKAECWPDLQALFCSCT